MAPRLKNMSFTQAAKPKGKQTGKDNRVSPGLAKKMGKPGMAGKKAK